MFIYQTFSNISVFIYYRFPRWWVAAPRRLRYGGGSSQNKLLFHTDFKLINTTLIEWERKWHQCCMDNQDKTINMHMNPSRWECLDRMFNQRILLIDALIDIWWNLFKILQITWFSCWINIQWSTVDHFECFNRQLLSQQLFGIHEQQLPWIHKHTSII